MENELRKAEEKVRALMRETCDAYAEWISLIRRAGRSYPYSQYGNPYAGLYKVMLEESDRMPLEED